MISPSLFGMSNLILYQGPIVIPRLFIQFFEKVLHLRNEQTRCNDFKNVLYFSHSR